MEITLPDTMKCVSRSDWKQIRDITADAFSEDPFNLWIFGNTRPLKALFGGFARDVYLKKGFCHVSGNDAATMWAMPGVDIELPSRSLLRLALSQQLFGTRGALKRGLAVGAAMERAHPKEPHVYLFTIGVRRSAQGKGLGKTMLAPVLEAADRNNLPVYLENTNLENMGFYNHMGFKKTGELDIAPDTPVVSTMWRKPRDST